MTLELRLALETTPKKAFATAVDWPGLSRSGKTADLACDALRGCLPRYAAVLALIHPATLLVADVVHPLSGADVSLMIVEDGSGGSGTDFGVPSRVTIADRRAVPLDEAKRLAAIVDAAWKTFDAAAADAPRELRKGPRGGGRDRDRIVAHATESDHAYAREIGIRLKTPAPEELSAVAAMREAMLAILREPSDGSPLAGRRWTARYAAHRIAWHALDHAWEIEDRRDSGSI